ncbi:Lipopolysaccharide-modifying protein [Cordyceps fumosorosea ARSEF 2679]|uniref:Lipopolysaccharide-modifying protein n=1 Tax=Cordyceps fumosorosea (strain ARSEF 2679) TaxID=1081104 RepID=A0A167ZDS8_CORFA|nr:Lipopolysaccharide-modifying protein [Cordyceps fumosorosea ARSEF 2679]OAA67386.1 Lipopolysaccharide-modifying protein [Cordyceps fumosorosea ARSEF 2679]
MEGTTIPRNTNISTSVPHQTQQQQQPPQPPSPEPQIETATATPAASDTEPAPPTADQGSTPKEFSDMSMHPIKFLTQNAQREFDQTVARQSTTLDRNDVQMIDEFDNVHDLITPFWGLKPATIRSRAKEALGYDNALLGIAIRDHTVAFSTGGPDWQRNATVGMLENMLPYLPDMNLAFNLHDEPRVVLPHDDLTRLVDKARRVAMPAAANQKLPANDFTATASELGEKQRFDETKLTRFNNIHREATWTNSRMSCAPDSPARTLEDDDSANDDMRRYALSAAGFVDNVTAMSDICSTPSLRRTYGFFDRPNMFKVTHDLFPVFSQSKISSYADLIYPSPWYWYGKVKYNETLDVPWVDKKGKLFWRGSTTGGFSRNGGWRRQHRQNFVEKINSATDTLIFTEGGGSGSQRWTGEQVPRSDHRRLTDVHFSHVGQCDPGDCQAQRQFFKIKDVVDMQHAWRYMFLLDMDGNAFSGRFYAFLRSRSQVFKLAVFREWHTAGWLRPWLHYVPLSMQGGDWLAAAHYYGATDEGSAAAEDMATVSREWAGRALRKVDMEAWFFRLLLEYARVIDDNREVIGFDMASADKKLPLQAQPNDPKRN